MLGVSDKTSQQAKRNKRRTKYEVWVDDDENQTIGPQLDIVVNVLLQVPMFYIVPDVIL